MTDENKLRSGNTFSAAAMGAMVGVVAGVTAMFLVDEKKRNEVIKKTQKVLKNIKDKVADTSQDVEDKFDDGKEQLADKLDKTAKKFKN